MASIPISILVSTRDRAAIVRQTLAHLAQQTLPFADWELLMVDNGSSDDTPEILGRAEGTLPLKVLSEPKPGKNRALNRALAIARGRLLVFTDDDVKPDPDWLVELLRAAERWPQHSIFGGVVIPDYPSGTPDWLKQHEFAGTAFSRFVLDLPEGPLPAGVLPFGPNYAVRATAMSDLTFCETIGPNGKNYPMGSETELLRRLVERGEKGVYVPRARVLHHVEASQLTLKWLFARSFRSGRGSVRMAPDRETARLFGVPKHLIQLLPRVLLDYAATRLRGGMERFEAGLRLHRLWGRIYEYRCLSREEAGQR